MTGWRARDDAVADLLAGRHGDPFALLGPHKAPGGVVLRAFIPGAETLEVLRQGAAPAILDRRDPEGFFEGVLPGAALPLRYRLRATAAMPPGSSTIPMALAPPSALSTTICWSRARTPGFLTA